jgi:hypothetical protein
MGKNPIDKIASLLDARRELLNHIKDVNLGFYNEMMREFISDRLTLTNFERELLNALTSISEITLFLNNDVIKVSHKTKGGTVITEEFEDFETALKFAIGLLHIK